MYYMPKHIYLQCSGPQLILNHTHANKTMQKARNPAINHHQDSIPRMI